MSLNSFKNMKTKDAFILACALVSVSPVFCEDYRSAPHPLLSHATIEVSSDLVTLVTVVTCVPENQQSLVEALKKGTHQIMSELPGFISSSVLPGSDGKRVINFAQWKSAEDIAAMRQNPAVKAYIAHVATLGTFESSICTVVNVETASVPPNAQR